MLLKVQIHFVQLIMIGNAEIIHYYFRSLSLCTMNAKLDNSDEDDFFDNPLKHLLPKVKSAKSSRNRLLTIEKNSDWNKGLQ